MKKEKKIAIVAKSPSSRFEAPFDDESWEIWTVGATYVEATGEFTEFRRITRWFEIHQNKIETGKFYEEMPGYLEWLGKKDFITHTLGPCVDIPKALILPKKELVEICDGYITNSVTWMIAHAIYEKATHIHLWGVDMAMQRPGEDEYAHQRPSCEYALGVARGRGIDVWVHPKSDLLKAAHVYGLEDPDWQVVKLNSRMEELDRRINEYNQMQSHAFKEVVAFQARALEAGDLLSELNGADPQLTDAIAQRKTALEQQAKKWEGQHAEAKDMLHTLSGARQEARSTLNWLHPSQNGA